MIVANNEVTVKCLDEFWEKKFVRKILHMCTSSVISGPIL